MIKRRLLFGGNLYEKAIENRINGIGFDFGI